MWECLKNPSRKKKNKKEEVLQHLAALSLRNILCGDERYWVRDTCYNPIFFSPFFIPFYFPFPLSLSGYISLKRALYPNTDLGIHMSPSSLGNIVKPHGLSSQPARLHRSCSYFSRSSCQAKLLCDRTRIPGHTNFLPCPQLSNPISCFCNLTPHNSQTSSCPAWFHIPPPTACQNLTQRTLYL